QIIIFMRLYYKLLFICLACLISAQAFSQVNPPLNILRGSPSVVANDARVKFYLNLAIPVVVDTASALNGGLDSLGLVVQIRATGDWYKRDTFPGGHKWTVFGSGTGGSTDSLLFATVARMYKIADSLGLLIGANIRMTD